MTRCIWLLLAAVTGSAAALESRQTRVPNHQIAAVVRDVAQWHDVQHADCQFQKAIGSSVLRNGSAADVARVPTPRKRAPMPAVARVG